MSRTYKEATSLPVGLLLALACATTACSAPYRSFYYASAGASLSKPITRRIEPTVRMSLMPFELGNVKGGLRPGWSVVAYPVEVAVRDRLEQFSAAAVGGRLYLFSHFVKGKTTPRDPVWIGFTPKPDYYDRVSGVPASYQVVALGLEMKAAPLAFNRLGYDGFGEATLFVTASIPHRFGWGLDFRTGAQYAVDSGGTLFARLEITMHGSRQRNVMQQEEETTDADWKASVDQQKE